MSIFNVNPTLDGAIKSLTRAIDDLGAVAELAQQRASIATETAQAHQRKAADELADSLRARRIKQKLQEIIE